MSWLFDDEQEDLQAENERLREELEEARQHEHDAYEVECPILDAAESLGNQVFESVESLFDHFLP